jgi:hypothetical protein
MLPLHLLNVTDSRKRAFQCLVRFLAGNSGRRTHDYALTQLFAPINCSLVCATLNQCFGSGFAFDSRLEPDLEHVR